MIWCIRAKWTTGTSDLLSLQLAERPDNTTLLHSKRQYLDQTAVMVRREKFICGRDKIKMEKVF